MVCADQTVILFLPAWIGLYKSRLFSIGSRTILPRVPWTLDGFNWLSGVLIDNFLQPLYKFGCSDGIRTLSRCSKFGYCCRIPVSGFQLLVNFDNKWLNNFQEAISKSQCSAFKAMSTACLSISLVSFMFVIFYLKRNDNKNKLELLY